MKHDLLAHAVRVGTPLIVSIFLANSAHAALLTTAPFGTARASVPNGPTCGDGGAIGPFTIVATSGSVCWPGRFFDLGGNGSTSNIGHIAMNDAPSGFTIDLGGTFAAAGFMMNYRLPIIGPGPILSALASDGVTILESYTLDTEGPISTPNGRNALNFRGVIRSSADIRFLRLVNGPAVVQSIIIDTVIYGPEPATILLIAPALLFLLRRHSW